MSKRTINLAIEHPVCRYCSRYWMPQEGVSATQSYCPACAESRKKIATDSLNLKPLSLADASYGYFLPRLLRPR